MLNKKKLFLCTHIISIGTSQHQVSPLFETQMLFEPVETGKTNNQVFKQII